jgi:1,2-diacylglycerol 3-alpha-glucosyltransferase
MRIAYLTQSYPPMISGAALVVECLAKAMAERGHQVLVVAASDKSTSCLVEEENLTLLRLRSLHNPLRVGQRFLVYPRRSVLKALREFDPEIIHVHEPLQLGWLGLEYAEQAKAPVILTIHQIPSLVASYLPRGLRAPATNLLWLYARWLANRFTSLIAPTQTTSKLVTRRTGSQVNTISSGIDSELFYPVPAGDQAIAVRAKWKLPSGAPILLHVGRLDTEKCVERVIQAAAGTLNQTQAHMLIVGDGSQKDHLIKLCHQLGIAERVHFTGFISAQEGLPEIYRAASLFVTASEIETQGIVLLEAAASGLPIVAVRATCIPEIVHDGINGYLTESGDIHGMAEAMNLLLDGPDKAKLMGRASRLLAEKHAFRDTSDAHEKLYGGLIKQAQAKRLATKHRSSNRWGKWIKIWASLLCMSERQFLAALFTIMCRLIV